MDVSSSVIRSLRSLHFALGKPQQPPKHPSAPFTQIRRRFAAGRASGRDDRSSPPRAPGEATLPPSGGASPSTTLIGVARCGGRQVPPPPQGRRLCLAFSLVPQHIFTAGSYVVAWPQGDQFLGGGVWHSDTRGQGRVTLTSVLVPQPIMENKHRRSFLGGGRRLGL